ncbi:MAG: zinc-binding dehydrogenase [Longimicrobiales bacterium]
MRSVLAAVIAAPGHAAEVREQPVPLLEPDSALLEVELSEVCGTDVHLRAGRLSGVPYPLIPGHVSVGRLGEIRGVVRDVDGNPLHEGDRVTFLDVHRTCNACWYCLVARATTRCPQRRVYGITYGAVDGLAGGWAQAVYLKPGTRIIPLQAVPPETFMAGGCSLPTALHAMELARIQMADTVLVLGSGPVGLSAVTLARMSGAGSVFCIGAPAERLAAAHTVGAAGTVDISIASPEERLAWVLAMTGGRGADVTIEATGAPEAVVEAMRFTRDAGRVIVVGQYTDHGDVGFNPHADLNRKHLEVRGCWGSDYSHFHRAVRLLQDPDRAAAWESLHLDSYSLANANEALNAVEAGSVVKALIDPRM